MSNSRHTLFRAGVSGRIASLVLVAVLFGTGYRVTAQAPPKIPITVSPQVIQPANGKLPSSMFLTVACGDTTVHDFTKDHLVVISDGLTLGSKSNSGNCSITYSVTIAANISPGPHKVQLVDENNNTLGEAEMNVMDSSAGPIPPGLPPQVDVLWEVMSQKNCSDVFGTRVAERDYCVQLKIGNNSGYALQVAGIGFSTQLDALKDAQNNKDGTITIANSSYASTRAVLLTENVTNGRNIAYNILQATGVLMAGFTPYFGTGKHPNGTVNNARTNWTTAASIVSGPLLAGFNIVAPNPVITQLNNLDDQSFRDSKIIANNSQIQSVVFVEKQALTYQIAALHRRYPQLENHFPSANQQTDSNQKAPKFSSMSETIDNSSNSRKMISFSRGGFSPFLVKLALGSVVIVGDQIQYLQRVQIQNSATLPPVTGPLSAKPSSVSFASGQNGVTTGTAQPITLTNTGTSPLTGITPQITGTNTGDFSLNPPSDCPNPLAPSGTCKVSVTYTPSTTVGAGSTRAANLQISYGPGSTPLAVALTGAASDTVYFSSTALTFATATHANPTNAKLTITNLKSGSITITPSLTTAITGTDHAMFSADAACDGPLANNSSCMVTVTFTPPATGATSGTHTATMTVTGSVGGATVVTQTVSLTGTI